MRYIALGDVASDVEFRDVMGGAEGDRMFQASELLDTLQNIERHGFARERNRWKDAPDEKAVKVYWDMPDPGETAIWAAIEVGADDRIVTMLKITDQYEGGNPEWHNLLADALDRRTRGKIK